MDDADIELGVTNNIFVVDNGVAAGVINNDANHSMGNVVNYSKEGNMVTFREDDVIEETAICTSEVSSETGEYPTPNNVKIDVTGETPNDEKLDIADQTSNSGKIDNVNQAPNNAKMNAIDINIKKENLMLETLQDEIKRQRAEEGSKWRPFRDIRQVTFILSP